MATLTELERDVIDASEEWADSYVNFGADYEFRITDLLNAVRALQDAQGLV